MFSGNSDKGFCLGAASEFSGGEDGGGGVYTPHLGASLNGSVGYESYNGVYKTTNYKLLEDQFKKRMQHAQNLIARAELAPPSAAAASTIATALSDADVSLQQLSIEARGSPSGHALAAEISSYAAALQLLQKASAARESQLPLVTPQEPVLGVEEINCINSRLIEECSSTALKTEEIGLSIAFQLRAQRDVLLHTNRLAEGTHTEGDRSRKAITKLIRTHLLNRVMLTATIAALALCIILLLLHKSKLFRFYF